MVHIRQPGKSLLLLAAMLGAIDLSAPPPPEPEKRDDEDDGEPDQMPPNKKGSQE